MGRSIVLNPGGKSMAKKRRKRRNAGLYRTKSGKFSGRKTRRKLSRASGGGWSNPCRYRYASNPVKALSSAFNIKTITDVLPIIAGTIGNGILLRQVSARVPIIQSPFANAAAGLVTAGVVSGLVGMVKRDWSSKVLLGGVGLITTKLADTYITPMIASTLTGLTGLADQGFEYQSIPQNPGGDEDAQNLLSGLGDYASEAGYNNAISIDGNMGNVGDFLTSSQESAAESIDGSINGLQGLGDLEDM